MFLMLFMMLMMTLLVFNPGLRDALSGYADPILDPVLPEESNFVLTVFILGTASMLVNTLLRSLFMDPVKQAHMTHRQRQLSRLMRQAQTDRDTNRLERVREMQQRLMPQQMEFQMSTMKPMMFTFVFIIAVFAWMTESVADYRVDYVSLPWAPMWNFDARFIFFPAWICTYIVMSAPLGRVVDRHLRLWRMRNHPLILSGASIPEPLLAEVAERDTRQRERPLRQRTQRRGSSGTGGLPGPIDSCPRCSGLHIEHLLRNGHRCGVCLHAWKA